MRVKDKRILDFKDIEVGDVFESQDGDILMKTEEIVKGDERVNAVELYVGALDWCEEYEDVIPLDADLVIKNR